MKRRRWLVLTGFVALLVLVIINFGYISQFIGLLHRVRWYVLILVLFTQGLSYLANAKYYQAFFNIFDYKIGMRKLYQGALAINFVNQVFPSGGVAGASFLAQVLDNQVPVGKATLAQLVRYVFTFLSFLAVLAFGFLLLFLGGNLNRLTVRLMLLFLLMIIVASLLLATVMADRQRIEAWTLHIIRPLNTIKRRFFGNRKLVTEVVVKKFFDEFYQGYHLLLEEKGQWTLPLLYALAGNLAEVSTVYVVFAAFGQFVNPGVVIAGYTLANVTSLASIFTSGVGIYEATMVASFAALGVPFALALSVTIVYRMLNFALYLPLGFYFYRKSL